MCDLRGGSWCRAGQQRPFLAELPAAAVIARQTAQADISRSRGHCGRRRRRQEARLRALDGLKSRRSPADVVRLINVDGLQIAGQGQLGNLPSCDGRLGMDGELLLDATMNRLAEAFAVDIGNVTAASPRPVPRIPWRPNQSGEYARGIAKVRQQDCFGGM